MRVVPEVSGRGEVIFKDRADAARMLAKKLEYLRDENPVILAIPRGGVVTGDVIAKELGVKLDIIVSRKIGAPENRELAIGAVMHDGSFYPNTDIITALNVPREYVESEIKSELKEIERRLVKFRGNIKYDLQDKTVVIVDDGIATGATMFAAIWWLKKQHPKRLVAAIPVGPKDTIERLSQLAEVVVLEAPEFFSAVGEFYYKFDQVEDSEVLEILKRHGHKP
ncbi:MAG TPA: phosphoribosyltransferase family protein [Candidatus Nitrosotalea sp.]|nr:phosphoribosyltransferase family protein [Candidatus Nitrosotalea sp.]